MTDLIKLAELDDRIVNSDQEDLEAIEALIEERSKILEEPLELPKTDTPPDPEPQIKFEEDPEGDEDTEEEKGDNRGQSGNRNSDRG